MKSKSLIVATLALLGLPLLAHSQDKKVFYKNNQGKLLTSQQADSLLHVKNEKVKSLGMIFTKEITNQVITGDTIIYEFSLRGTNQAVIDNQEKYSKYIGKPLPEFSFKDINGKLVSSKDLIGKPLVINMWFTTCAPCVAEIPQLNKIQATNKDAVFLAITYETKEKVNRFLKKRNFSFRHITDAKAYCEQFTQSYPLNIFVSKSGIINNIIGGMPLIYDAQQKKITEQVDSATFQKALAQIK